MNHPADERTITIAPIIAESFRRARRLSMAACSSGRKTIAGSGRFVVATCPAAMLCKPQDVEDNTCRKQTTQYLELGPGLAPHCGQDFPFSLSEPMDSIPT